MPIVFSLAVTFQISADSIGEKNFVWENDEVKVCWAGKTIPWDYLKEFAGSIHRSSIDKNLVIPSSEVKNLVQDAVTKDYTKEETGIHFIGWKDCADDMEWDVAIITGSHSDDTISNAPGGRSPLDQGSQSSEYRINQRPNDIGSRRSYVFLNIPNPATTSRISRPEIIRYTAVHEFGHTAMNMPGPRRKMTLFA